MPLQDYSRPSDDNGLGMHFGHAQRKAALDQYIPILANLRVKWCIVPHKSENDLHSAAQALWAAGIMPVSRWICKVDQPTLEFTRLVATLKELEIPPYVQILNEPGDSHEWESGQPDIEHFAEIWTKHASAVATAGGYPGLQVMGVDELTTVLDYLYGGQAAQAGVEVETVLDRMWFSPHCYGSNHPPDYPYDARNQQEHPGATVFQDNVTVLSFLEFAPVFQKEIHFVPPFIVSEGGWSIGNGDDSRYPAVDGTLHARYHQILFSAFQAGQLPNGDPLPNYLFAFCPWILFGPEPEAWHSWTTGTRVQTHSAIRQISPFIRKFPEEPAPPPPTKLLRHYVLFGPPSARATHSMLLGARNYLLRFAPTLGFDASEAGNAEAVTIVGDVRLVSVSVERQLRKAGCRVERLGGDQYAADAVFADRVARDQEFD